MAQQHQHSGSHVYYFVVLILLSYVLSGAPRYVRQMRSMELPGVERSSNYLQRFKEIGKVYAIDPYVRAWSGLKPDINFAGLTRISTLLLLRNFD